MIHKRINVSIKAKVSVVPSGGQQCNRIRYDKLSRSDEDDINRYVLVEGLMVSCLREHSGLLATVCEDSFNEFSLSTTSSLFLCVSDCLCVRNTLATSKFDSDHTALCVWPGDVTKKCKLSLSLIHQ
jgi:hypothetical protein